MAQRLTRSLNFSSHLFSYLRFGYPWMIVWALGVHVIWGIGLLFRDQTTSILLLVGLNKFLDLELFSHQVFGVFLILVAFLALVGLLSESHIPPKRTLALLLPQYCLMLVAFLTDFQAIIVSENPVTGVHIDRLLMVVILGPMMLAAILHTLSIIERFVLEPRRVL